jgi:S-adenosylmethionine decarboxylase
MKRDTAAAHSVVRFLEPTDYLQACPETNTAPLYGSAAADHFVERDGVSFAGAHLILDFWGAKHLDDIELMEHVLRECVVKCGATLLHIHLHHFLPSGGISGVAVLAESHISVHTWPERNFAAFDIFMCGLAKPEEAIAILKRAFLPQKMTISENLRGVSGHA